MKKIIFLTLTLTFLMIACTSQTSENEKSYQFQTTMEQETTRPTHTWPIPDEWPERNSFLQEGGHYLGGYSVGRYRTIFYSLSAPFVELVGREVFDNWQFSRNNEEFHNECIAISFIRDFNINREDFEKANYYSGRFGSSWESTVIEIYPVDLIFSFDNERINEFFRWENSIFAHEVGLPNPLRGEWTDDGWVDHPNWTENPAWRDHPFWPYLPFGDINDSTSVVWDSYAEFRAANP